LKNRLAPAPYRLGQAIVTNYYLPEKRLPVSLQVNVSYDSDPRQVERVLLEIAQAVARDVPGMLADPTPSVSWDPGFGDSSVGLSLNYSVSDFSSQFAVRTELRRRIFERFRQERIEMPFPTRTVFLHSQARAAADGGGDARLR
jgi:small-conductance mechanosensitive channel